MPRSGTMSGTARIGEERKTDAAAEQDAQLSGARTRVLGWHSSGTVQGANLARAQMGSSMVLHSEGVVQTGGSPASVRYRWQE